ncbi:MAG: EAL domain-containing protein [Rhizobiaceae bacterium]|nr:EAL domain-containing protein [Rhizobiaceae bacterium]
MTTTAEFLKALPRKRPTAAADLREPALERPEFSRDLDRVIAACMQDKARAALALVSIDHLDIVNTAFGHAVGSKVLGAAREALIGVVRSGDSVWRFSGSKFAVILRDCSESDLKIACRRFRDTLTDKVFDTCAGPVSITASVGAVMMPRHAHTQEEATTHALVAVEDARRDRWRAVALYQPNAARDRQRANEALAGQSVITAIAENRLRLAFQPVLGAVSRKPAFHEALVRIEAKDGTLVDARDFITAAERLGLVRLVDHRTLELALDALRETDAVLSINISGDTCHDPAWLSKLATAIEAAPALAKRLIVEITESHVSIQTEAIREFVDAVRAMGLRVAIDDFGAGYTSFRILKTLPFDIIKIDGDYARGMKTDPRDQVFVRSLVSIAKAVHAETVVEWVDDSDTADLLAAWGVDYLQGYGMGKPQRCLESGADQAANHRIRA